MFGNPPQSVGLSRVDGHFDAPFGVGLYVKRRMLQCSNRADAAGQERALTRLRKFNQAEKRRHMSSGKSRLDLLTPSRRELLLGAAALSATALVAPNALAQSFPTAKVNTTGLAVTDTEVTVGILHSVTGTMAISETGSVQAEKLAI